MVQLTGKGPLLRSDRPLWPGLAPCGANGAAAHLTHALRTVEEMALRGKEFVSDKPEELRRLAMSPDAFTADMFFLAPGEVWKAPAGAYKRCGGPT